MQVKSSISGIFNNTISHTKEYQSRMHSAPFQLFMLVRLFRTFPKVNFTEYSHHQVTV